MTYIEIINSVLRRLRESVVATPDETDYSALLGEFVNETKREVEDAWNWQALRQTYTVNTAASTSQYAITGVGKRFRQQSTQNSVWDDTNEGWLRRMNASMMKQRIRHSNAVDGKPSFYYFEGFDTNEDPYINFYPVPDAVYDMNVDLVVPQADLSDGADVLSVPSWPVVLGTYSRAIAERGEDSGRTAGEAEARYLHAVSDAISLDESLTTDETTWYA